MDGVALGAWGCGAGEKERLGGLSGSGDESVVYDFVILESVVVVHSDGVGGIVVLDVFEGDAFAEVGFEAVDA